MVSSFINPVVNPDAKLGVSSFDRTAPVRLLPHASESEFEVVIRAVYQQVLGNTYLMQSERLVSLESQLKQGELSVRGFVCQVAQSAIYRSRFFENCSRMRSIELNFKHLLGRAPESYAEIAEHSDYLDVGFEIEIEAYIYSDEYLDNFGEDIVPYYRGYKSQTGRKMVGFTHMLTLLRGAASSDNKQLNNSRLNTALMSNRPSQIRPVVGANLTAAFSDVDAILAELFKSTQAVTLPPTVAATPTISAPLHQQAREQSQTISTLQQQLAELSPFAAIGSAYLSDWQSADAAGSVGLQLDAQAAQIAKLQAQIADARRYATIGESRLNKWRSRSFNG
jgi:phycoerythrin-associated linker protein